MFKRYLAIFTLTVSLLGFSACQHSGPSKPPGDKEVYNFFEAQLKQTAKASGFLKYRLTIDKLVQDTIVGTCTQRDRSVVPCFTITVDRTEYLDNYTGTYSSVYIGDVYHLYRDEYGKLAIIDHSNGSVMTKQDLHTDDTKHL